MPRTQKVSHEVVVSLLLVQGVVSQVFSIQAQRVVLDGPQEAGDLKAEPKGHGAEKKGAGETADKSAGSMLNGAPKRAK